MKNIEKPNMKSTRLRAIGYLLAAIAFAIPARAPANSLIEDLKNYQSIFPLAEIIRCGPGAVYAVGPYLSPHDRRIHVSMLTERRTRFGLF